MAARLAGLLPAALWRGRLRAPVGGGRRSTAATATTAAAAAAPAAGGGGVGDGVGGGGGGGERRGDGAGLRAAAAAVAADRVPPFPAAGGGRRAATAATAPPAPAPGVPPPPPPPVGGASNIPPSIWALTHRRLYASPPHPLAALTGRLAAHLATAPHVTPPGAPAAALHTALDPVVPVDSCFDALGVPADHPSRAATDTYYLTPDRVLRPHMTAHTVPLLGAGTPAFLTAGDVYRRDTIDATHYPAFHQMDGVRLFPARAVPPAAAFAHLRLVLLSTARALFGPAARLRWVVADFPFTSPSVELEVWWAGEWLELLGAGLLTPRVLAAAGWEAAEVGSALDDAVAAAATGEVPPPAATPGGSSSADAAVAAAVRGPVVRGEPVVGWAFGLGLDRLAMVLHGIPDIRLLWSRDERFLSQFRRPPPPRPAAGGGGGGGDNDAAATSPAGVTRFVPYSKYPPVSKDLSFWLPPAEGGTTTTTPTPTTTTGGGPGKVAAAGATGAAPSPPGGTATPTPTAAATATTVAADDADDLWRGVENSVCEVVRATAGDVAEAVTRVGEPYTRDGRTSLCYRVTYRSMDRSLTHAEVDALQARVREGVVAAMGVRLR